jgi:antitoxin (DNA-binding transcriptional repressor) of toxin-antitoxin stability system
VCQHGSAQIPPGFSARNRWRTAALCWRSAPYFQLRCPTCGRWGLRPRRLMVIMTNMRRCSVADAKAHLPELITDAERDGRETIIERRGHPVARIAPLATKARRKRDAVREFDAAIDALKEVRWKSGSATIELQNARGRLD